eukprot:352761-Chlamydomonas_euryale.AAC.4
MGWAGAAVLHGGLNRASQCCGGSQVLRFRTVGSAGVVVTYPLCLLRTFCTGRGVLPAVQRTWSCCGRVLGAVPEGRGMGVVSVTTCVGVPARPAGSEQQEEAALRACACANAESACIWRRECASGSAESAGLGSGGCRRERPFGTAWAAGAPTRAPIWEGWGGGRGLWERLVRKDWAVQAPPPRPMPCLAGQPPTAQAFTVLG